MKRTTGAQRSGEEQRPNWRLCLSSTRFMHCIIPVGTEMESTTILSAERTASPRDLASLLFNHYINGIGETSSIPLAFCCRSMTQLFPPLASWLLVESISCARLHVSF